MSRNWGGILWPGTLGIVLVGTGQDILGYWEAVHYIIYMYCRTTRKVCGSPRHLWGTEQLLFLSFLRSTKCISQYKYETRFMETQSPDVSVFITLISSAVVTYQCQFRGGQLVIAGGGYWQSFHHRHGGRREGALNLDSWHPESVCVCVCVGGGYMRAFMHGCLCKCVWEREEWRLVYWYRLYSLFPCNKWTRRFVFVSTSLVWKHTASSVARQMWALLV